MLQKIKEKIKQDLITRYQGDEIENILHVSMYLDPASDAYRTTKKGSVKCSQD